MNIIYSGLRAENYDPARAPSFEYVNFYGTLARMPDVSVIEYPFDDILTRGKRTWNEELFALTKREVPDVLFVFMYSDEVESATLDRIRRETKTKVVLWFADDYWRFWNYSRFFTPHADLVVTTAPRAVAWYRAAGHTNVMLSQWAANPEVFRPMSGVIQDIDVSFVGQYKPSRAAALHALERAGIRVEAFGLGWPARTTGVVRSDGPNGRVMQSELPKIYARSKINLNLNDRPSRFNPRILGRLLLTKHRNRIVPDFHLGRNFRAWTHFGIPHIHARPFELAACGAFVLSGSAEGMDRYYAPDKEMVFFRSHDELVSKTKYYLAHPDERERIAMAGYERTIREHTYEKRFAEVFRHLLS